MASTRRRRALITWVAIAAVAAAGWSYIAARRPASVVAHPMTVVRLLLADPPRQLVLPVAGLRPNQLRDSWHAPRSGGRLHQGIDIFAPRGRPVLSTTDGIVVSVGENPLGGRVVRILGPGGQTHYYAHLDRFGPVSAGQLVPRGTVIGYVGDSGNARGTPPHLHYGVYELRGGAVNPYPLLAGR